MTFSCDWYDFWLMPLVFVLDHNMLLGHHLKFGDFRSAELGGVALLNIHRLAYRSLELDRQSSCYGCSTTICSKLSVF